MSESGPKMQYVQITIRLGGKQHVRIEADSRVTYDATEHHVQYQRNGYAEKSDIDQLVADVLSRLKAAFGNEENITLCVDGEKLVACQE